MIKISELTISELKRIGYKFADKPRSEWINTDIDIYNSMYTTVRNRIKRETSESFAKAMVSLDNGAINEVLKPFHIYMDSYGNVKFIDSAKDILTKYLKDNLPAIEKALNINGIKLSKSKVSATSWNLIDWSKAKYMEDEDGN